MKLREVFRALFYFHGKDYQNSGKNLIYAITSGGISHPLETIPRASYSGDNFLKMILFQRFDFNSPDRKFHPFTFELEDIGLSKKLEYLDTHSFWMNWHFFTHFKCIVLFVLEKNSGKGCSLKIF